MSTSSTSSHHHRRYGETAGPAGSPAMAAGTVLRFASYNIHAAVGTDGRRDVDRIADVIREIEPDVIALQEVDSRRARGGLDQAQLIASALDMFCVEGPILEDGFGWYGNAILSKRQAFDVEHWRYPKHSGEPRAALSVRIDDIGGRTWRVIATHLDLRFRARSHQVDTLVQSLIHPPHEPLALLADVNEWWPWAPSWQKLMKLGHLPAGVRSFPSWFPLLRLDRAVLRHCHITNPLRAHLTPLSRRASDHLPIVVDVTFNDMATKKSHDEPPNIKSCC